MEQKQDYASSPIYYIEVGVFRSIEEAEIAIAEIKKLGYHAFLIS